MKQDRPIRHRVFVYGTLRQGQANAYLLEQHGVTQWTPATLGGHRLVSRGAPWPYCCAGANAEGPVVGEMVEVTPEALADLDVLEGVPHHYERRAVEIVARGALLLAWVYVDPRGDAGAPVPGNDWVSAERTRSAWDASLTDELGYDVEETIPCELCGKDTTADDCDENGYCSTCVQLTTPTPEKPPTHV